MVSFIGLAIAALVVAYFVNYYKCLAQNIAVAKQSGIPYVITPVYTFNRFWLVTHRLWLPLLYKLPQTWTQPWIT